MAAMKNIAPCPGTLITDPDGAQYELGEIAVLPDAGETCKFKLKGYTYTGLVTHSEIFGSPPVGAKVWASDLQIVGQNPG